MPIKTKDFKNGHNPDLQEAPEILEEETTEVYAASEAPQVRPDLEEEQSVLRSFLPDTEEDLELGFRALRPHEYKKHAIPGDRENRELFRTREKASKNLFKISAARLGQHFKELATFKFPPGYLQDKDGLTPECMAELRVKIAYTSENIFPSEDLSKFKRGQLPKVGISNPKYPLRFQYWEKIAKRSEEYQSWLNSFSSSEEEPEVCEGEFFFTENSADREERHSQAKSDIELNALGLLQKLKAHFAAIREEAVRIAEDEGLKTRQEMDKAHAKSITNPETLEEDEDDL